MRYDFTTPTGLTLSRVRRTLPYDTALDGFAEKLDRTRGGLFSSGVDYPGRYAPGTIVIDTATRFLYLVQPGGKALRYGVGVGRPGFG
ncbi:MAG: hypothetical protein LCH62_04460, partial [Proteobacteria bacterium]|nr:hypothetical protein [Pseudomonadota bacterium]